MTLEVLQADDEGFVLAWEIGETLFSLSTDNLPRLDELQELSMLRIVYEAEPTGEYRRIRNLDELARQMDEIIDLLVEIGGMGSDDAKTTREILSDDQVLETIFTQDILLLHSLYGSSIDTAEPTIGETLQENPFGGEPFPATITVEIVTTQDAFGCVVALFTVAPDPEHFFAAILDAFGSTARQPSPSELAELEQFEVVTTIEIVYDPGNGAIKRVSETVAVSAFDGAGLETVTLARR